MRIVFASHTHMGGTFVVGSHHLAREMVRSGHVVAHVSTPITPLHLLRFREAVVRERFRLWRRPVLVAGVLNVVPMVLIPRTVLARVPGLRTLDHLPARRLRRLLDRHLGGSVDLMLVDQPKLVALTALLKPDKVVYRPTDIYSVMPGNAGVEGDERKAIARSDVLVATSAAVAEHVAALAPGREVVVFENGFEYDHFIRPAPPPEEYQPTDRKRAVYVGALDYRFDFDVFHALAGAFPEVDFYLVGPAPRSSDDSTELPNVHALGPRSYETVPGYLQNADIGLLPLNGHAANRGRSPMKLYEYGAAGLQVLASSSIRLSETAESFTRSYQDEASAITQFGLMLGDLGGERVGPEQPTPALVRTREQIKDVSWERITARLVALATA